jgi:multiple sugar transport system substrate-binding protein
MKKLFHVTSVFVALALMLAACATPAAPTAAPQATDVPQATPVPVEPTAPPSSEKVQIRWFVGLGTGTDPGQVEIENKVVEAFNASHPNIELIIEVVAYEAARDTLATEIASGSGPDIVGPVGVSGAEAFHGQWLDLADLIAKHNYDLAQFDEGAVNFYKEPDGQFGLPFAIFPSVLFYQRDHFDEAGLAYPPHKVGETYTWPDGTEEEWTMETLTKLALKLTVDENGKDATDPDFDPEKIVQVGYHPQWQDLRAIGSYFGAGSLVASDSKTANIPPEWADAWKWVYDGMWKDHFIANGPLAASEEFGGDNVFNSGRGSMALTHLWYTCCLGDAGGNWDVAVVPSYNGKITSNFNADTFRVLKGSQHPDEAFEVLTYLLGEASLELLGAYGGMPARTADQPKFFADKAEQYPQDVDWPVFVDMIAYADNPSFEGYMPNYNEAFDFTNTFLSKLKATEGLDMDAEIEQFKKDLQAIFDK